MTLCSATVVEKGSGRHWAAVVVVHTQLVGGSGRSMESGSLTG